MLKALIRKQLQEILAFLYRGSKAGKRRSKAGVLLYGLLMLYVAGVVGFLFYMIALQLYEPLAEAGISWLYHAMMGLIATVVGVIGSVFTTGAQLYEAKDNEALLAMPIPAGQILFVRMLMLYAQTLVFEALVLIPAAIVNWQFVRPDVLTVVLYLAILFTTPFAALALACVIGWLVTALTSRMKNKSLLTVVLSLAFIVLYYYGYSKVNTYLQLLIVNSEAVSSTMRTVLYPFYQLGKAAEGDAAACVIFVLMVLALFAVVYFILSRSFLRLVTTKRGSAKVKYEKKAMKAGTIEKALFQKELRRFKSSPVYIMNCSLGSILALAGAVLVLVKGDMVLMLLEQMPAMKSYLPLLVSAAVAMTASMNTLTAPSISLEGKNMWLLQSLPVQSFQVLKSKLMLHLVLTLPPMVVCTVVFLYQFSLGGWYILLIPAACVLFACFTAVMGLLFNLKLPNLNWTSETAAVKQGMSVMLSMLLGWGVLFLFGIVYWLVREQISGELFLAVAAVLLSVLLVGVLRWLKVRGSRILEQL